jgi:hypothetical protein
MKTILKRSFYFLAACLLLSGCENKLGEGVTLEDIAQGATSIRINIGEQGRLYAYPIPYDCTNYEFKWESANTSIVTVDDFGRLTTAEEIGTTTVSVSQGNIRKEYSVEVYEVTLAEKLETLGVKAFWEFRDANDLLKATKGPNLEKVGPDAITQVDGFNSRTKAVSLPCSEKVGDVWQYNYLKYVHGFAANGGGQKVNEFTIVIDCKFPGGPTDDGKTWTNGKYYSLYQTAMNNTSDGDFFWRPGADYGITGNYTTSNHLFVKDKWYRFVISAKLGSDLKYFMNGVRHPAGSAGDVDGERAWGLDGVLLFADEDGEDGQGFPIIVASLATFDRALSEDEIKSLGGI